MSDSAAGQYPERHRAGPARLDVANVRVTGAPASFDAASLRTRLNAAMTRVVTPDHVPPMLHRQNIPSIRLQLPHAATETDVADALARAITDIVNGRER